MIGDANKYAAKTSDTVAITLATKLCGKMPCPHVMNKRKCNMSSQNGSIHDQICKKVPLPRISSVKLQYLATFWHKIIKRSQLQHYVCQCVRQLYVKKLWSFKDKKWVKFCMGKSNFLQIWSYIVSMGYCNGIMDWTSELALFLFYTIIRVGFCRLRTVLGNMIL